MRPVAVGRAGLADTLEPSRGMVRPVWDRNRAVEPRRLPRPGRRQAWFGKGRTRGSRLHRFHQGNGADRCEGYSLLVHRACDGEVLVAEVDRKRRPSHVRKQRTQEHAGHARDGHRAGLYTRASRPAIGCRYRRAPENQDSAPWGRRGTSGYPRRGSALPSPTQHLVFPGLRRVAPTARLGFRCEDCHAERLARTCDCGHGRLDRALFRARDSIPGAS